MCWVFIDFIAIYESVTIVREEKKKEQSILYAYKMIQRRNCSSHHLCDFIWKYCFVRWKFEMIIMGAGITESHNDFLRKATQRVDGKK